MTYLHFLLCSTGSRGTIHCPPGEPGARGPAGAGLDLPALERAVQDYYSQGIAHSTARSYKLAQNRYSGFCRKLGVPAVPLTETTCCKFVASLATEGKKHTSIKCYLSATRHLRISIGLPDPFAWGEWPRLQYVLKGIKRSQAGGTGRARRLPITLQVLRKIQQAWSSRPPSYLVSCAPASSLSWPTQLSIHSPTSALRTLQWTATATHPYCASI